MILTDAMNTENFFKTASKRNILDSNRKVLLHTIATTIADQYTKNGVVNLNFICTHNSRRSQLAQVWSFFASYYFSLNIQAFSGGTEVTAFHRNTIKTLQEAGFSFKVEDFSHQNPKYLISFKGDTKTCLGFSKMFDNPINEQPFIAITTCNNADSNCPFIPSASFKFHMPFIDPKASDTTNKTKETYLKTNQQIAAEIFYLFSEIKKILNLNF